MSTVRFTLILILLAAINACGHQTELLSEHEQTQNLLTAKQALLDLNPTRVKTMLAGVDINRPLPDGSSLLSWAVETQEPGLVKLILDLGASTISQASNRFTPMIVACQHGNAEIITQLLAANANPQESLEDGTSAAHLCAATVPPDTLAQLAQQGADLFASNHYGQTPLMFAANAGNTAALDYLVDQGAEINQPTHAGYSPLLFAIKSGSLETAQAAISRGADLNTVTADGTTPAQLAIYAKNYAFLVWFIDSLDQLLPDGNAKHEVLTAFDRNGHQLLHSAVAANQPTLAASLLNQNASPDQTSAPSTLTWRYEANFKTEDYIPPQLTAREMAAEAKLEAITALFEDHTANFDALASDVEYR